MNLSRNLLWISLIAPALALAGCGSSAPGTAGGGSVTPGVMSNGGATKTALKVGLLTPGDINDQGWNQLAYEGLQAVATQLGAQTAHQVTENPSDQQPALRDFGDQHYNAVFCHGFEYGERVLAIAPKYPDTKFVVVGGNVKQQPNVATLVPKLEEATYLLGMVAGGMTKSNVIGAIGGENLPVIKSTFDAFEDGAQAVNPRVQLKVSYVGNFEDQNAAKEASKTMIAQGADFVFQNVDQAGKGVFAAAQEAGNVYVFGSNRNQNAIAPNLCLASAVIEMPKAFVDFVKSVQQKTFKADFIELNMPNRTVEVEWNPALKSKIPITLMQKVLATQARIESGALKIKRNV